MKTLNEFLSQTECYGVKYIDNAYKTYLDSFRENISQNPKLVNDKLSIYDIPRWVGKYIKTI